jgi:hypothetical protein
MSRLHDFERLVDAKLRKLFRGSAPVGEKRELIEVHRAILDEVGSHVESLPRGRRTFAFAHLIVSVLVSDAGRRRSYEVAFVEADTLARDIAGRLADEHVELPEKFRVEVELLDEMEPEAAARGFDISYKTPPSSHPAVPTETQAVWLKVLSGKADRSEYSFRKTRINLGRLADIVDANQRLIRRNDVAFDELSEAPNPTVSRSHAHIEFDRATGQFRLFDDRSAQGTTVLHEGKIIPVPKGASKGVQLRPGDEIVLGQARLSFDIHLESQTE